MTLAQEQIQALKAQQYTPKLSAAICVEEEAKCLKCSHKISAQDDELHGRVSYQSFWEVGDNQIVVPGKSGHLTFWGK